MQPEDIESFADTLTDGFSTYNLFIQILGGVYDKEKMKLFWTTFIHLLKGDNDGYLFAFATHLKEQHHGYGATLLRHLLNYLDANNLGCYLKTFDEENIGLYEHFGFELMERGNIRLNNFPLFAMYRRSRHFN